MSTKTILTNLYGLASYGLFGFAATLLVCKHVGVGGNLVAAITAGEYFEVTSCQEVYSSPQDECKELLVSGNAQKMKTVMLETDKGKVFVEHGSPEKDIYVPFGYKLLSCYCDQPECLAQTPTRVQRVITIRGKGLVVITKY